MKFGENCEIWSKLLNKCNIWQIIWAENYFQKLHIFFSRNCGWSCTQTIFIFYQPKSSLECIIISIIKLCSDDGPRESETLTELKYIIAGISSPLKTLALAGKVAFGGLEA